MLTTRRPSLISYLYEAKRFDPQFIQFCNVVKTDLKKIHDEEESFYEWKIPSGLPKEFVIKQIQKQSFSRLRFSLATTSRTNVTGNFLQVYDPSKRVLQERSVTTRLNF